MSVRGAVTQRLYGGQAAIARAAGAAAAKVGGSRRRRHADAPSPPPVSPSELHERRDRLARELAELQWDLGGLAYEMAIRDHFRVDVLSVAAARLQAVDGELAEIERLLRLEQAGAGGACAACGALHARGAPFCWQCGSALLASTPVTPA